jgi:RNA 2',3'-cyclic 3'-phosphodiesterase
MRLAGLCGGVPGARWVRPENYHLSLRFIGEVENGVGDDVDAALGAVAAPSFALDLHGVGVFGKTGKARLLWAGVAPNPALLQLQAKVEAAVARAGLAVETRRFAPHITLARLSRAPAGRVEQFVVEHADFRAGPFPVTRFHLYSSFLSASGAIYTKEADYDLE